MIFPKILASGKRWIRILAGWLIVGLLILLVFSWIQVAGLRYINPPFTAFMFWDFCFSQARVPLRLNWVAPPDMSVHVAQAVLAAEDQRFFQHHGFDWQEIERALADTRDGRRLRGASTITMQAARNIFLWPGRSWLRKALEAYYTLLLELMLSKTRILEIYLNVVEFGPGIYGVSAAAGAFFHCRPDGLTSSQAAALAVVLPAPKVRSPLDRTAFMTRRKQAILRQMGHMRLEGWPQ